MLECFVPPEKKRCFSTEVDLVCSVGYVFCLLSFYTRRVKMRDLCFLHQTSDDEATMADKIASKTNIETKEMDYGVEKGANISHNSVAARA